VSAHLPACHSAASSVCMYLISAPGADNAWVEIVCPMLADSRQIWRLPALY
jgi:hypothetical protein